MGMTKSEFMKRYINDKYQKRLEENIKKREPLTYSIDKHVKFKKIWRK